MKLPRLAVVGATGMVGEAFRHLIRERNLATERLDLVASRRSAGKSIDGNRVIALEDYDFSQCDIAFFSAGGSISRQWAPMARAAGAIVIDNSSAFRMEPDIALVVPEVNGHLLDNLLKSSRESRVGAIIANPNCSTIQMLVALAPLHRAFGITELDVTTYQAASGAGRGLVDELRSARAELGTSEAKASSAFELNANVVPWIGAAVIPEHATESATESDAHYTDEEWKLRNETRKILDDQTIKVQPTCVRVPVETGHSEVVTIRLKEQTTLQALREELAGAPGVKLLCGDDFATPRSHGARQDSVYVSRLRPALETPNRFTMWVVACNLYKGAALNGIQIAETVWGVLAETS